MQLAVAYLLDLLVGDPRQLPHPVIYIGRLIALLDKWLRNPKHPAGRQLILGAVVVVLVLLATTAVVLALLWAAYFVHPYVGVVVTVVLLSSTLAVRSLSDAAADVARPLKNGDLPQARHAVSMIVGRDTNTMDEAGVVRATVETVAENTVDGVTAPLFYGLLGGLPLAMTYKAINTMDSMLGYKNQRYLYFGRAAAKLDDVANWLPARLTVFAMLMACRLLRLDAGLGWQALKEDGSKHPSPNSGLAESLTAGALGITLGGENSYGGQVSKRPQLWSAGRPAQEGDITRAVRLMKVTSFIFIVCGLLIKGTIIYFGGKAVL